MKAFKPEDSDHLVARAERVANNVASRLETSIEKLATMVPRSVGAEKVSYDDELREYIDGIANTPDPKASAAAQLERWEEQFGAGKGLKMFIEYVHRNEKRLHDIVEKG